MKLTLNGVELEGLTEFTYATDRAEVPDLSGARESITFEGTLTNFDADAFREFARKATPRACYRCLAPTPDRKAFCSRECGREHLAPAWRQALMRRRIPEGGFSREYIEAASREAFGS